jgi:hypothetical protein
MQMFMNVPICAGMCFRRYLTHYLDGGHKNKMSQYARIYHYLFSTP